MRKIEVTITPVYEILKLHKDGNPNTDWSVSAKTYTDRTRARRELDRLVNTGMYKAAILRNIPLQSRDELIQRMNDLLQEECNRWLSCTCSTEATKHGLAFATAKECTTANANTDAACTTSRSNTSCTHAMA